jgi:hypothetical protein
MSHSEVRSLPIRYRRWYLDRLAKHFRDRNKKNESVSEQPSDKLNAFAEFEKQINSKLT